MRSKASQRIRDRKRIARQRRNVRCRNLGTLYGNAARLQQENVQHDRQSLWSALKEMFEHLNRGPVRANQKEWER